MDDPAGTITLLLRRSQDGEREATDALFECVLPELRTIARKVLRGHARLDDLSGTALINDACERLLQREMLSAADRRHFFFLFGRAMNDVLIDQYRRSRAAKRGSPAQRRPLFDHEAVSPLPEYDMLDLREAFAELRRVDPKGADLVNLRFFCGKSLRDAAAVLGCSLAEVRQNWSYAQAWLAARLRPNR